MPTPPKYVPLRVTEGAFLDWPTVGVGQHLFVPRWNNTTGQHEYVAASLAGHTHDGADIVSGVVADARIDSTLTNKSLVTPTIASFVNANHNHSDAAGGGVLAGYQALHANLTALAGLTGAADKINYFTGLGAMALADFTSVGRNVVGAATQALARTALGLGTIATEAETGYLLATGARTGASSQTQTFTNSVLIGATHLFPAAVGLGIKRTISPASAGAFGFTIEGTYTSTDDNVYGMWFGPTLSPGSGKNGSFVYFGGVVEARTGLTVTARGISIPTITKIGSGTLDTVYGLYISAQTAGANNYGLNIDGTTMPNFISGPTRIGAAGGDPSAQLEVGASTVARASMRIRTGVAPTSPNDGDWWYDGVDHRLRVGSVSYSVGTIVRTTKIAPAADSTNALGLYKANGSTQQFWHDSTNGFFGFGVLPLYPLHVKGASHTRVTIESPAGTVAGFNLQSGGTFASQSTWTVDSRGTFDSPNNRFVVRNQGTSISGISVLPAGWVGLGGNEDPTAVADLAASTVARASLRIRTGVAPTSPNDGDCWFDGTDFKARVGGVTKTFTLV